MPALYLTHGGGPMPLLSEASHAPLTKFIKGAAKLLPEPPKAIVIVTAHWEEGVPTIGTHASPPMLYDYSGFPPESYEIKYPAPGPSEELVRRVKQLLNDGGLPAKENSKRGFDHGTFVPLALMFPDAKIPVLQMSILSSMDPHSHYKMGAALAPLLDEGVLLIGSGSSFHNMRGFAAVLGWGSSAGSEPILTAGRAFDDWLTEACTQHSGTERQARLEAWAKAPGAKLSHPREEHLVPLMVVAGAAGQAKGHAVHQFPMGSCGGAPMSSFMFN